MCFEEKNYLILECTVVDMTDWGSETTLGLRDKKLNYGKGLPTWWQQVMVRREG